MRPLPGDVAASLGVDGHAPIAPSSLALTIACNASVQMQAQAMRLPETEAEAEGTAWHYLALQFARGHSAELPLGGKFAHRGRDWDISAEMRNGALLWAQQWGLNAWLERSLKIPAVHEERCAGTPDGFEFFPQGTGPQKTPVLRVGDYKGGHRYVEVFENAQLLAYYAGIRDTLQLDDLDLIVEFMIVQPRSYTREGPVRTWRIPAVDLRPLINLAHHAAHAALSENPIAKTGNHCIDCKARHLCQTLRFATGTLMEFSGAAELAPLDPHAMGHELRLIDDALKQLEARQTGLAAQVEAILRSGISVPFYEMRPGRSSRKWHDHLSVEDIAVAGDLLGVNLRKEPAVITPAQAIDAGIDETIIGGYADRPPPGLKLQRSSSIAARKALGTSGVSKV